jgi:hypothetical protein
MLCPGFLHFFHTIKITGTVYSDNTGARIAYVQTVKKKRMIENLEKVGLRQSCRAIRNGSGQSWLMS